jgi:hypothetical protein
MKHPYASMSKDRKESGKWQGNGIAKDVKELNFSKNSRELKGKDYD